MLAAPTGLTLTVSVSANGKPFRIADFFSSLVHVDGRFRRLLRNYPEVEAEYRRRVGFRPGLHIIAVRRDFVDRHPQAILVLMDALKEAWALWWAKTKRFGEASPWMAREVETMPRDFADEMPPCGMASPAHRAMVAAMCREQFEQKLVPQAADASTLFKPFEDIERHRP
ncbi:MAG: hypothetical protein IT545_06065 [Rhodobacteraceae bacterium]|nr:hypothetical protein [Paracoccaceae bacterium]